jgi:hypothetical protein
MKAWLVRHCAVGAVCQLVDLACHSRGVAQRMRICQSYPNTELFLVVLTACKTSWQAAFVFKPAAMKR